MSKSLNSGQILQKNFVAKGDLSPPSQKECLSLEVIESEFSGVVDTRENIKIGSKNIKTPTPARKSFFFCSKGKSTSKTTELTKGNQLNNKVKEGEKKNDLDTVDFSKLYKHNLSVLDKEFPMIPIRSSNSFKDNTRYLYLFTSIFFFFFVTSFKFFIVKRFEVATFCDIRDWTEFADKIKRKIIITIDPIDCVDKCSHLYNILLTKVFESNYYFFYCINTYYLAVFVLQNKLKKWIITILTYGSIPTHIIGHAIFWNNKSLAFFLGNFLYVLLCPIIIKQSWVYFKIYFVTMLIILYFTVVKFFFEMIFPFMLQKNAELTFQFTPIMIYIIKYFGFQTLKISYFIRYTVICKIFIIHFFILFEFLNIGSLHSLINTSGFTSNAFWFNILQHFLMEFISIARLMERFYVFSINKFFNKKKIRYVKFETYSSLYYGMKIELELFCIFIYFLLISTQYYDYCMGPLVDCMGRPTVSMSPIRNEHFYLLPILLGTNLIQELILYILGRYTSLKVNKIFMKIEKLDECIAYIIMLFGVSINFGLPGLYSMMFRSEDDGGVA